MSLYKETLAQTPDAAKLPGLRLRGVLLRLAERTIAIREKPNDAAQQFQHGTPKAARLRAPIPDGWEVLPKSHEDVGGAARIDWNSMTLYGGRAGSSCRHSASQTRVNALMAPLGSAASRAACSRPVILH